MHFSILEQLFARYQKNLADMLGIKPVYRRVVETACGIKNIDIGKCQICLVDYTDVFISQDVYILDTIKEPLIGYTLLEQLGLEYKPETGKIEHVGLLLL